MIPMPAAPGKFTSEFRAVLAAVALAAANAVLAWVNPRIGHHVVLTDLERAWIAAGSGGAATFIVAAYSTHRTWLKAQIARIEGAAGMTSVAQDLTPDLVQAVAVAVAKQSAPAAKPIIGLVTADGAQAISELGRVAAAAKAAAADPAPTAEQAGAATIPAPADPPAPGSAAAAGAPTISTPTA